MTLHDPNCRSEREFQSHYWTIYGTRYLHFGWPFDAERMPIILGGKSLPPLQRQSSRAFGICVLDALFCFETFASETLKTRGDSDFHFKEERRHSEAIAAYREVRFSDEDWHAAETKVFLETLLRTRNHEQLAVFLECYIEPMAGALAALLHSRGADPLLVRMCSFIIADEFAHNDMNEHGSIDNALPYRSDAVLLLKCIMNDCVRNSGAEAHELEPFIFEYVPLELRRLNPYFRPAIDDDEQEKSRKLLVRVIADDATEFLQALQDEPDPMPPVALAVEWMAAGLRSASFLLEECRK